MSYKSIVNVSKSGNSYSAIDISGNTVTGISTRTLRKAFKAGSSLGLIETKSGKSQWRVIKGISEVEASVIPEVVESPVVEVPTEHQEVLNFIHSSYNLKPQGLVMNELKWKYLVRSAVRGKNIMMTGQAGCGKTMSAKALVNALDRPDFYFNLGATQDPRATLIGNVHFNEGQGT